MAVDELGRASTTPSVRFLRPGEEVFREMLSGWRNQQLSRNLQFGTVDSRERLVQRLFEALNEYPWNWAPAHVDLFFRDLRAEHHASKSTIRSYQGAVRMFCDYVSSPDYGWPDICERMFGTPPVQVCHDWNTARHAQEAEAGPSKRAFTREELQAFFDRADEEPARIAAASRKGWLPAFRDAVVFKAAYAWGLRRNEVRHLQTVDFSRNPKAREFGRYGVLYVRYGKAMRGSPPKRRSVLTVFDWAPEVMDEWVKGYLPRMGGGIDLFTGERETLVSGGALLRRFRTYCDDLGLPPGLDFHSLRRSYVTHLIEAGIDARFVQEQAGHEYASTTAIYTCVSSDYRTRTLRTALDSSIRDALRLGTEAPE